MALTLGFTSMDPATETALRAAFSDANETLRGHFELASDSAAQFVVIDMDSLYGPMGWLRLHAADKQVVGLTAAARTQADFRLGRPFDTAAMVDLLQQIARSAGVDLDATPAAPSESAPETEPATETAAAAAQQTPAAEDAASGTDADAAPEARVAAEPEAAAEPASASAPETRTENEPEAALEAPPEAEPAPEPEPEPEPAPPPRDPVFADWMQPGALTGRLRFQRGDGPQLWIDADARQYHGPRQLKQLVTCFDGNVEQDDFEPVDEDAWAAGSAAAGPAQPLLRLQWLGGLLAGGGELLPGYDPEGRYRLTKWPETEREYARHFRIATAMMRAPATLDEIAEASGATVAEVADFTNANLATGFAEFVPEPEPEPQAPPKSSGFFSRFRGRS